MSAERVSPVDAAWLRMDRAANPMMITALLQLEGRVPFEEVRRSIGDRLLRSPRFRQKIAPSSVPLLPPSWTDDEAFSLDAHVHRAPLGGKHDADALRAKVSALMSTPLERSRPLWDAHVVEDAPEGTAVIARVHHAVGDGVALVRILLGISDHDVEGAVDATSPPSHQPHAEVGVTRDRDLEEIARAAEALG